MIVDSFFQALKAGNELASAETWKNAQQLANSVTALLVAIFSIAGSLGFESPVDQTQIGAIAGAAFPIVIIFNWIATAVSSKRSGLFPRQK